MCILFNNKFGAVKLSTQIFGGKRGSFPNYRFKKYLIHKQLICLQLVRKLPAFYGNPKVHNHVHKIPPPYRGPSQSSPPTTILFLKDPFFIIILPCTPTSANWSPALRSPHPNPVCPSPPYVAHNVLYRGADKSLTRPTFRCILFDGGNISLDASLVIYINSINIPPIMITNRRYQNQNLLSL